MLAVGQAPSTFSIFICKTRVEMVNHLAWEDLGFKVNVDGAVAQESVRVEIVKTNDREVIAALSNLFHTRL